MCFYLNRYVEKVAIVSVRMLAILCCNKLFENGPCDLPEKNVYGSARLHKEYSRNMAQASRTEWVSPNSTIRARKPSMKKE
jgi:hypothetical protein